MNKSKLEKPGVKERVVKELATGKSQSYAFAKENGISQASVSRFMNKA